LRMMAPEYQTPCTPVMATGAKIAPIA
jgi:hypothetical protein